MAYAHVVLFHRSSSGFELFTMLLQENLNVWLYQSNNANESS